MSYFDLPRIYFAGRFFSNPSTINNKLANYSPDVKLLPFSLRSEPLSVLEEYAGFQYINPYGLANFCFTDCVITGFHTEDDIYLGENGGLGNLRSTAPYAKMIDLDPDQQSISQIYGLNICVQFYDGSGFQGSLEATSLHDLWYGRVPGELADRKASGCFQTLMPLEQITWLLPAGNSLAGSLKKQSVTGISLKFVLDAYQGDSNKPDFNYGRVIGIIGPGLPGEPIRFPGERRLNACGAGFGPAYWKLDCHRQKIIIDLSNSIPLQSAAGEAMNLGHLQTVMFGGDGTELLLDPTLDYSRNTLIKRGGIIEIGVTAEQCNRLETHALGIRALSPWGHSQLMLREHHSLKWINCDPSWLRLAPEQSAIVTIYARQAGKPLKHEEIDLAITQHDINNRPRSGIEFPALISTDEYGQAQTIIRAHNPQPLPPRRAIIDSQVYYIGGSWQVVGDLFRQSGGGVLSVLVFNKTTWIEKPNWVDHIEPIFTFYARLYPGMSKLLSLENYDDVCRNAAFIRACLLLPHEHPLHFPPSRDLSPDKAAMICRWIACGCP